MKRYLAFLLFFAILLIVSASTAGTIDPYNNDDDYIAYAKHFDYVGRLEGSYDDKTYFTASATAIDDHHILTAAHVVQKAKSCVVIFDSGSFPINHIMTPKEFRADYSGRADIALCFSEQSFRLRFYPQLYKQKDETGKVCCISGYGSTGTFSSGAILFDKKRRAGSNIVDVLKSDLLICSPSTLSEDNRTLRTSLEFLISQGDSGGGLFIDGQLAGVNSCVISDKDIPNSSYDDLSGHTRVSKFIDWIQENRRIKK